MIIIKENLENLKVKYKDKLYANKKNPIEIINYMKDNFTLVEVDNRIDRYKLTLEIAKINCSNTEAYRDKIAVDDMNFLIYEIIKDERSNSYYQEHEKFFLTVEPISFLIETNTGYFYSSCNKLQRCMFLFQGISQEEIDNDTGDLSLYLRLLDVAESESSL